MWRNMQHFSCAIRASPVQLAPNMTIGKAIVDLTMILLLKGAGGMHLRSISCWHYETDLTP